VFNQVHELVLEVLDHGAHGHRCRIAQRYWSKPNTPTTVTKPTPS